MTIKTTCYCDSCNKDLDQPSIDFKITVEMFGALHFCNNDCMRKFLERRWGELDAENAGLSMTNMNSDFKVKQDD